MRASSQAPRALRLCVLTAFASVRASQDEPSVKPFPHTKQGVDASGCVHGHVHMHRNRAHHPHEYKKRRISRLKATNFTATP
ncbi:exported hypothetical protein [Paraburkholderia tropica]|nr:exported hypothetical protein [Paraburkholderia tropica]